MKKYYILASYECDLQKWCVQFGGYNKGDVQFELEEWRGQDQVNGKPYTLRELVILTLPCGDTATMELHMKKLNERKTKETV